MYANFYDLSILLGYSYMKNQIKSNDTIEFDIFSMRLTPFTKILPKILNDLMKADEKNHSNFLCSLFFLSQMMQSESNESGQCLICDKQLSSIKKHYKYLHNLTMFELEAIFSIVGDDSIFFMPINCKKPCAESECKKKEQINQNISETNKKVTQNRYIEGFFLVKNIRSQEDVYVCALCYKMMEKKHATKHWKEHMRNNKNQVDIKVENKIIIM